MDDTSPGRDAGRSGASARRARRAGRGRPTTVLVAAVAVVLIALSVMALGWRLTGGRWYDVRTPSMGQAAPVGTLLLTRPTHIAELRVGDIITFHAPGTGEVYSHRVVATTPAGVRTRGDINPVEDPWVVTNADLIGKVVYRGWALGWLLRGLPLLVLCAAVVWLATVYIPHRVRSSARLFGAALAFAFVARELHPWVGLVKIGETAAAHGVLIHTVSVGIIPIRAEPVHGGTSARLVDGQVGSVGVRHLTHGGYHVNVTPSLTLWWWVGFVVVCLAPLLWSLLLHPDEDDTGPDPAERRGAPDPGGLTAGLA